ISIDIKPHKDNYYLNGNTEVTNYAVENHQRLVLRYGVRADEHQVPHSARGHELGFRDQAGGKN
ncbi:hypothetical protein, partial [Enterobacter hormaechei]|uniref:hypothetical protein n=1 Tax=Enterobacter hormaechei TaxID=158836 RepID=UPI001A9C4D99